MKPNTPFAWILAAGLLGGSILFAGCGEKKSAAEEAGEAVEEAAEDLENAAENLQDE